MNLRGAKQISVRGIVTLRQIERKTGKVLSEETFSNTITNMGIDQVAGLINGQRASVFDTIQLGTSGTAAVVGDIALKAVISIGSLSPAGATATQVTTDTTNDTAKLLHTFSATASYTVKEVAIATSASSARILGRTTNFTAKALDNGSDLQVSYSIDVD